MSLHILGFLASFLAGYLLAWGVEWAFKTEERDPTHGQLSDWSNETREPDDD